MNAKKYFETILEYLFLLILGGSIYYGIEMLFRGHSHWTMFLVGGICFILIGWINEFLPWETPIWYQIIIGDIMVLIVEFISGCIVNLWLGWNIWDYSNMPLNLLGQICLPFALLWLPVVLLAIVVDDWAKYLLGRGDKPHYNWTFKTQIVSDE